MKHDMVLYDFIREHGLDFSTDLRIKDTKFYDIWKPTFLGRKKIFGLQYIFGKTNKEISILIYTTDEDDLFRELKKKLEEAEYKVYVSLS